MAQSKNFFGHRQGSTRTLTFMRRSGIQVTQDRKDNVRDARTLSQVQHRCLLHTTIDACTWLAPLFGFSWAGAKTKQKYQDAFRRANYVRVRQAALGSQAGWTYSPYKQKTTPMGYFQVASGSLPYRGHFFQNGINGIDYTETDFLNSTAEGDSWYQLLSQVGLHVGNSLLLYIMFVDPVTSQVTCDVAKVILNVVDDVTIGQQPADSLVTIMWLSRTHNWQVINNPSRILSLRLTHSDYNPSSSIMCTACFQVQKKQSRLDYSTGYLWHWSDNISGMTFDQALATYPLSEDQTIIEHPVDDNLWVDLGLPSGLLWATRNIDITQKNGFAVSPYQYKCSFCSWGNVDMYNPNAQKNFVEVYNWGGINSQSPWYEGQPYGETEGSQLQSNIGSKNDAATQILGGTCRMPSSIEFKELFDNCDIIDANGDIVTAETSVSGTAADKRITMNGVVGIRLRSKINGNIIFFPASGYGNGTSWSYRGNYGNYWASSWRNDRYARSLNFYPSGLDSQNTRYRYYGFTIRPIMVPSKRKVTPPDDPKPSPEK